MEDDTMEVGAGMQLATAMPSRTPAEVHGAAWPGRVPHALPSPVPDALASGVHVSAEHRGAHIAIVERVAALAGLAVGGTHEHELALVVDGGSAHGFIKIRPFHQRPVSIEFLTICRMAV